MREQRHITLDAPEDWSDVAISPAEQFREVLADRVRTIYCICVREQTNDADYGRKPIPRWDGGEDSFGSKTKAVWPRIADAIMQLGADPLVFIRAQFTGVRRAKPPTPNQLYGEAALARWEDYRWQAVIELQRRVDSDFNQIKIHVLPFTVNLNWPRSRALDYVLRDMRNPISPLIRYCVAAEESLPIAAAFRERAILQYLFQMTDYDEYLGDRIPQELKDEAAVVKAQLVG